MRAVPAHNPVEGKTTKRVRNVVAFGRRANMVIVRSQCARTAAQHDAKWRTSTLHRVRMRVWHQLCINWRRWKSSGRETKIVPSVRAKVNRLKGRWSSEAQLNKPLFPYYSIALKGRPRRTTTLHRGAHRLKNAHDDATWSQSVVVVAAERFMDSCAASEELTRETIEIDSRHTW
jgi:hypothetical protein